MSEYISKVNKRETFFFFLKREKEIFLLEVTKTYFFKINNLMSQ